MRQGTCHALCVAGILVACAGTAHAEILYDVDFSTPPHTVGEAPASFVGDLPRRGPSRVVTQFNNSTTVVSAAGPLVDQPAVLEGVSNGGVTLEFAVNDEQTAGFDSYQLELSLVIEELASADQVRLFADFPRVNTVIFDAQRKVSVDTELELEVGSFEWNEIITVR
jgi:hypothetical protein